jgi:hypothetical protein
MDTAHIHKQLDSETVPELKPFVGKQVEIYVFESARPMPGSVHVKPPPSFLPKSKSVEELAREQGIVLRPIEQMVGGWPEDELNDGFEKAVESWHAREIEEELERRSKAARQK